MHIVDYVKSNGDKFTLCDLVYLKPEIVNFFAMDNSIKSICRTCYEKCEETYDRELQNIGSGLYDRLIDRYDGAQTHSGIQIDYWFLDSRYNAKLSRYHRQIKKIKAKKKTKEINVIRRK